LKIPPKVGSQALDGAISLDNMAKLGYIINVRNQLTFNFGRT